MKKTDIEQELTHTLFLQREYEKNHLPYNEELAFYEAVKNGNISFIKQTMLPLTSQRLGHLSDNPKRNLQYHLIICITLITRFCIEGGMETETAYTLSDLYIQKTDACTTLEEIQSLHKDMIFDYAKRMHKIHKESIMSQEIILCIDYIFEHLHSAITIKELANHVHLNPNYLSLLFKKEVGITIASYIRNKKIETAKNLLRYSDYSYVDISNYLAFNSHSHFILVFKKQVGMTPKQYRLKFYRSKWKIK